MKRRTEAAEEQAAKQADCTKAHLDAAAEEKAARKAKQRGEQESSAAAALADAYARASADSLRPLLAGEDVKHHFESLRPLLDGLSLDASLALAVPNACCKPFGERSSFDAVVLRNLDESFSVHIQRTQAEAVAAAAKAAELNAAAAARCAEQEQLAERRMEVTGEVQEAQRQEELATAALRTAKSALTAFDRENKGPLKELEKKQTELADFASQNMGCYHMLCEKLTTPSDQPQQPEQPEQPELDVPMDTEPTELGATCQEAMA